MSTTMISLSTSSSSSTTSSNTNEDLISLNLIKKKIHNELKLSGHHDKLIPDRIWNPFQLVWYDHEWYVLSSYPSLSENPHFSVYPYSSSDSSTTTTSSSSFSPKLRTMEESTKDRGFLIIQTDKTDESSIAKVYMQNQKGDYVILGKKTEPSIHIEDQIIDQICYYANGEDTPRWTENIERPFIPGRYPPVCVDYDYQVVGITNKFVVIRRENRTTPRSFQMDVLIYDLSNKKRIDRVILPEDDDPPEVVGPGTSWSPPIRTNQTQWIPNLVGSGGAFYYWIGMGDELHLYDLRGINTKTKFGNQCNIQSCFVELPYTPVSIKSCKMYQDHLFILMERRGHYQRFQLYMSTLKWNQCVNGDWEKIYNSDKEFDVVVRPCRSNPTERVRVYINSESKSILRDEFDLLAPFPLSFKPLYCHTKDTYNYRFIQNEQQPNSNNNDSGIQVVVYQKEDDKFVSPMKQMLLMEFVDKTNIRQGHDQGVNDDCGDDDRIEWKTIATVNWSNTNPYSSFMNVLNHSLSQDGICSIQVIKSVLYGLTADHSPSISSILPLPLLDLIMEYIKDIRFVGPNSKMMYLIPSRYLI